MARFYRSQGHKSATKKAVEFIYQKRWFPYPWSYVPSGYGRNKAFYASLPANGGPHSPVPVRDFIQ